MTVSFFPGSYLHGDDQVAYSVAKAADDRMVAVMAAQLRARDVTAVALYPGLVRTEGVLRAGDSSTCPTPSRRSSSVGRWSRSPPIPASRAGTGRCLVAAELAETYGFTDVDGARPRRSGPYFAGRAASTGPVDREPPEVT